MLNMIKMDLYRMFRTKSLYVIWIIMAVLLFFTTSLAAYDYKMVQQEQTAEQSEVTTENINIGIEVVLPTEIGETITVCDLIYANMQGKVFALFLVIFTVIFSTADMNSGYLKTIGGQVKNRGDFIFSKFLVLVIFICFTVIGAVILQIFSNRITFGYLEWGNVKDFFVYISTQVILHCALVCMIMTISILLQNNVWSIVIAVCMCMNVFVILYSGIDKIAQAMGIENLQFAKYTITGKIAILPMGFVKEDYIEAFLVGIIFIAVFVLLGKWVFQKRDIS